MSNSRSVEVMPISGSGSTRTWATIEATNAVPSTLGMNSDTTEDSAVARATTASVRRDFMVVDEQIRREEKRREKGKEESPEFAPIGRQAIRGRVE